MHRFKLNCFQLIACAVSSALALSASAKEFRSADTHPLDYPTVQAVLHMGKLIEERSKGRHSIKMFPSSQLGQEKDTIEQTKLGAIDLNRVNMGPFNNIVPETVVPSMPFVFRSVEHMRKVVDGPIGDDILKSFEAHGFVGLAFFDSGARSFYNSKKPIRTVDDLKGMKIRVQQSDLFVDTMRALGANATPMPFGEVYTSLKTGVIDGAENNWPSYESTKHFEVAKFYSINEHSMSPEVLVMSKRSWDALSAEDQAIVRSAAKDSVKVMRDLWDAREKSAREKVIAGGAQINTVDKVPFIDAMRPVYEKYLKDEKLRALLKRIQDTK
ncbi:MAG: TRAP transporter substrate-binding protein [Betaproteobacteria bacterium]|nr:MAG: TRAP transporter substrate-binding protein [Betaproteobacteria bacterium]